MKRKIKIYYCNSKEYAPCAEIKKSHNRRTIKVVLLLFFISLFIKALYRSNSYGRRKNTIFSARHRVAKNYIPRMTLHRENIIVKKSFNSILRECVQAKDDSDRKNTNAPRTLDLNYRQVIIPNQATAYCICKRAKSLTARKHGAL